MDWREHIHSNPDILAGKPVVRGTRLSVEFLLRLFAEGWTEEQVLASYPQLTRGVLKAILTHFA